MISKNTVKRLSALAQKKYRLREGLFLVEGDKMVLELAGSGIRVSELYLTEDFEKACRRTMLSAEQKFIVDKEDIRKISQLKNPQNSVAVCRIPAFTDTSISLNKDLTIYLDGLQDPGNLGTIIRICDWFGIDALYCSSDTVDAYNPKVIQASMGSYARVRLIECEFERIKNLASRESATVYGAFMDGANIYNEHLNQKSILVMGNEGNGIRPEIETQVERKISIPNFSVKEHKAESLNVSVATAILCSEFKRRG